MCCGFVRSTGLEMSAYERSRSPLRTAPSLHGKTISSVALLADTRVPVIERYKLLCYYANRAT